MNASKSFHWPLCAPYNIHRMKPHQLSLYLRDGLAADVIRSFPTRTFPPTLSFFWFDLLSSPLFTLLLRELDSRTFRPCSIHNGSDIAFSFDSTTFQHKKSLMQVPVKLYKSLSGTKIWRRKVSGWCNSLDLSKIKLAWSTEREQTTVENFNA